MSSMSHEDSANCPFEVIKFPNKTLAMKLRVGIFEGGDLILKALRCKQHEERKAQGGQDCEVWGACSQHDRTRTSKFFRSFLLIVAKLS
jgi:hypothetical protein